MWPDEKWKFSQIGTLNICNACIRNNVVTAHFEARTLQVQQGIKPKCQNAAFLFFSGSSWMTSAESSWGTAAMSAFHTSRKDCPGVPGHAWKATFGCKFAGYVGAKEEWTHGDWSHAACPREDHREPHPPGPKRSVEHFGKTKHFFAAPSTGCCTSSAVASKWVVTKLLMMLDLEKHFFSYRNSTVPVQQHTTGLILSEKNFSGPRS